MSAFGQRQQAEQQALQALSDAVRALEDLRRASHDAGRATDEMAKKGRDFIRGDSFLGNAAMRAGRNFGIDAGVGILQDVASFGGTAGFSYANSATANVLRAGSKMPIVGDIFSQAQEPLEEAGNRLKGIMTMAGRVGSPLSDEAAGMLMDAFLGQGKAAKREAMRAEQIQDSRAGQAITGTDVEDVKRGWSVFMAELKEASEALAFFKSALGFGSQR